MAYGLTCLMGILMWYGSTKGYDLTVFPTAQMMYPAAGVTDGSGMQYVKEWIAMFQNPVMWINIVALPINYFFVFIAFFGEEYGLEILSAAGFAETVRTSCRYVCII